MSEYKQARKDKQAERVAKLERLLKDNPTATHKELAATLGVSTKTIQRLIKQINK